MSRFGIEASFIDGAHGRIFVLLRRPVGACRGAVLLVPPFAEEMNKSRKILTDLSQELLRRGFATVLPDVWGTGDSAGEFRDAEWPAWEEDLVRVAQWLHAQGLRITGMCGVRLGCILGAAAAKRFPAALERTVFWQPVLEGERLLTQFLRLRVAASLMQDRKESVGGLRAQLAAGETVEVAGYELSGALARQLDGLRLGAALHEGLGELHWIEVSRSPGKDLPGATAAAIDSARDRLRSVRCERIDGEPFWASTEIVRNAGLVNASAEFLAGAA